MPVTKDDFREIAKRQRARAKAFRDAGHIQEADQADADASETEAYVKQKWKLVDDEHMRKMRAARKPRKPRP